MSVHVIEKEGVRYQLKRFFGCFSFCFMCGYCESRVRVTYCLAI